jgi:DNA topoisomerase-6 subunit B
VPLQYQPKACAISEAVYQTNWRSYEVQQPRGGLPVAPMAIAVHLASVWVPFTSEAKEAVAHYDELMKELKLAIQECGRKLGAHLRARERDASEHKRLSLFQRYIPEVAAAIGTILGQPTAKVKQAFDDALPNFVNIAEEKPDEGSGGSSPPPAPSEPPPPADEARHMPTRPPPRSDDKRGKGSKAAAKPAAPEKPAKKTKKKAEQLELL